MKTNPVGARIECRKIIYEVTSTPTFGCDGCAFMNNADGYVCNMDMDEQQLLGECSPNFRPDDDNVIFKQVGEVEG